MGILGNFQVLRDNWAAIDLVQETNDVASTKEKELADLNRQQLYVKGENTEGKKLKKYRNAKYARVKHEMNPKPGYGTPDFYVTGEFQRSIFADVRDDGKIIFDAADPKVEFLVERDGESIFGLQDKNKLIAWSEILRPPLLARISTMTGAKLI